MNITRNKEFELTSTFFLPGGGPTDVTSANNIFPFLNAAEFDALSTKLLL